MQPVENHTGFLLPFIPATKEKKKKKIRIVTIQRFYISRSYRGYG